MKLTCTSAASSYDIILKRGCLANLHQFTDLTHRRVFILTDSGVPRLTPKTCWHSAPKARSAPCPRARAANA